MIIGNFKCSSVMFRAITPYFKASCKTQKTQIDTLYKLFCRSDFGMASHSRVFVSHSGKAKSMKNKVEFCSDSNELSKGLKIKDGPSVEPPSNLCCMAGCANCVWMVYADKLIQDYEEKGITLNMESVLKEIDENVDDPTMKAFIKLEIKSKLM